MTDQTIHLTVVSPTSTVTAHNAAESPEESNGSQSYDAKQTSSGNPFSQEVRDVGSPAHSAPNYPMTRLSSEMSAGDTQLHLGNSKLLADDMYVRKRMAHLLLRGWCLSGHECPKCRTYPWMSVSPESIRHYCVVCDESAMFDGKSVWEFSGETHMTFSHTNFQSTPSEQRINSMIIKQLAGHVNPSQEAKSVTLDLQGRTPDARTMTINLTGEEYDMSGVAGKVSTPTSSKEERGIDFNKSFTQTNSMTMSQHGGIARETGNALLPPPEHQRSDLQLTHSYSEECCGRPTYCRQGAMPLHLVVASRAVSEASAMLHYSISPTSCRPPVVNRSLFKAQGTLADVVEKLTTRVQSLAVSTEIAETSIIAQNLEALSRSVDILQRIECLCDYGENVGSMPKFPRVMATSTDRMPQTVRND